VEGELFRTQRHVTLAAARAAIDAGLAKAAEIGVNVGLVVVDASGEMVASARMDKAGARTWMGGMAKAKVAASMGRSTEDFLEQRLKKDEVLWRALSGNPDAMFVPGGFPLLVDGKSVGGVGASGGHYNDDAKVAKAAADRFHELLAQQP
jgi:uncharacterized protein GlcG (DUF336 family)